MDCSMPGLPVQHQLLEFTQTHVHWVGDAIQSSYPLSPPSPPASMFPNIRLFSNESVLPIMWPKYWSFSFNISPPNEYSGLISFRMDWLDLLAVQGTLKSLLWLFKKSSKKQFKNKQTKKKNKQKTNKQTKKQFKSISSLVLSFLCSPTLTSIHDYCEKP